MRPEAFPGEPLIARLEPQEIDEIEQQVYLRRTCGRLRRAAHERRRAELAEVFAPLLEYDAVIDPPSPSLERKTVSPAEAAALTGVTVWTVREWIRHEKVDYMLGPGGRKRIFVDTLFRTKDGAPVRE